MKQHYYRAGRITPYRPPVPRRAAQPVSAWTIAVVLLPASAFIVWALWRAWL